MEDVSVIIPCRNAGRFLSESVHSALQQSGNFSLKEVIVVDDHSSDPSTRRALQDLASQARVTVLANSGREGSAAARNLGIRHALTRWIAFLDADDWWTTNSLQKRFEALGRFPDARWIGADFVEKRDGEGVANQGRFERNLDNYDFLRDAYASSDRAIRLVRPVREFLKQTPTHTVVTLVKKELLEQVGCFDERFLRQQDYHLFLRLAEAADYVFVPEVVAVYRLHQHNSTRSLVTTQAWRIKVLRDLIERSEFAPMRAAISSDIGKLHLANCFEHRKAHNFILALVSAWGAVRTTPLSRQHWKALAASALLQK